MRKILWTVFFSLAACLGFGQTPESADKFEAADVHASPKAQNQNFRTPAAANGRYTVRYATMVDLIRTSYGVEADKVLGGPSWLEMRKFDIVAKVPSDAKVEDWKPALQALLADRFKLVLHQDTKPLPAYALTAGKKPQLKEAEGTEEAGCKTQTSVAPSTATDSGGATLGAVNGTPIGLNSDLNVQFLCRNLTIPKLGEQIRSMLGASLIQSPILDRTGLKGAYNFDVRITMQMATMLTSGGTSVGNLISDALEKQLGLKLERVDVPTPVILVDSVAEQPSDNSPGLAEIMPPIPPPAEFEVASVKLVDPNPNGPSAMSMRAQPGGRFVATGIPLSILMSLAFSNEGYSRVTGTPTWMGSVRVDVNAKAPAGVEISTSDRETLAPMMLSLLKERFGLKYHSEEQQVTAYTLVAAKPKLKQSDPKSRTYCKSGSAPAGSPAGTQIITCQNISMDEFADWLRGRAQELTWPVLNGTDLDGRWDFSFTFSPLGAALRTALAGGGASAAGGPAMAADPIGGVTIFEALEKQAGLKLTAQKRPQQMIVIDHLEQKPTEN